MIMSALTPPLVEGARVAALHRLGRGLRMPFHVGDQEGAFVLEPGRAPEGVSPLCVESALGVLAFSEPNAMFSLMGECPVTLAEVGNDPKSWFWELFQHHLSPQVRALFGYLRVLPAPEKLGFGCRFTVMLGPSKVAGYLWLAPQSLLAMCAAGAWRSTASPLPASFPLAIAVTLGRLSLPIAQLRGVRAGDVLMLERAFFDVQGRGHLSIGSQRLQGRIDDESGPLCLNLIAIEEASMDEEFLIEEVPGPEFDQPVEDVFGRELFDDLSMALTVRCGVLNLTLGELRNLAPGAVLGISGYAPGVAGLYYGERPIGQGQLVEVDGRLGLKLSRVVFSR
ncbi:FliM/FliN family flagellar motor switch protein [Pseudomonas sp. O64]|uniref:FliM/FliN family flagellar motor switch protein n=1 Tax=Pseudomonas TaxID=286 RepID=UPI000BA0855F|nr:MULTISPECIES: FliM/FliN family flagellar motor switch protein [unclassified Pseudomonas]MCV2230167.1 FliM/FliN family flagellar motor switch protein [Pseudomonas sp. AU10]OZO06302.1 type III secretion protein [Pseudomonas sp. IB20]UNM20797.1 FliM/FliN family flagellar motor switch protein [Pseudomonas sp. ArH3a]UXZ23586.1 FliM/FliN family flagellar motor switch protein [Pseudomonas sp. YeP6b]